MNFPPSQVTETEMKNNQQDQPPEQYSTMVFGHGLTDHQAYQRIRLKRAKRSPRGLLKKWIKMPKPQVVVVVHIQCQNLSNKLWAVSHQRSENLPGPFVQRSFQDHDLAPEHFC